MRSLNLIISAVLVAACSKDTPTADPISVPSSAAASANGPQHNLNWGPAPAVFPPGAEMVVMQGDPGKAEPFTIRLRFPNGYKISPHTHPTTENVTVLTGTFLAGMGTRFLESDLQAFGRNDFVSVPAEHAHYAMARGQTVVQVQAMGPFALTYVNPADTPAAVR